MRIVVQESTMISAIHLHMVVFLYVDMRGAGGEGEDQEKVFHSVSPSGLGCGLMLLEGTSVSSQLMLWS